MTGPEIVDLPSFLEPRSVILAAQKELKGMDQSNPNIQQALVDIRVTLKRNAELEKAGTDE